MTFGISGVALAGLAVGGATIASGMMGADAAEDAANAQAGASAAGIAEQRRQFEAVQALLKPYIDAGTGALGAQQNLIGLGGPQAQQQAIQGLQTSPQFTALMQQGENAMLQNASATGGLRGGNLQAGLAQFRPQLLSQLIESQFGKLGSITGMGQASATGQAAMGQQMGGDIANLLAQQGAARAGGIMGQAQAYSSIPNAIAGGLGVFSGLGGKF